MVYINEFNWIICPKVKKQYRQIPRNQNGTVRARKVENPSVRCPEIKKWYSKMSTLSKGVFVNIHKGSWIKAPLLFHIAH